MNFPKILLPIRHLVIPLRNLNVNVSGKEKWDLLSAICVERKPVITRDYNELETNVANLLKNFEEERSYKSDFEIRLEKDMERAKDIKEGKISLADMDDATPQTGEDFLDLCRDELEKFKFAPRKEDENVEKDTKSLKRALDRYLVLIIKDKIGQNFQWVLPQGKNKSGETLRQTAERILNEKCGENIQVRFMGNAPYGFYKYKYPRRFRENDIVGAKIFFFKAQMLKGQAESGKDKCWDYQWVTRSEMTLLQNDYLRSVKMFLIDEEH